MEKVKYLTDAAEFVYLLSNDDIEVKGIDSVSDEMVRIEYKNAEQQCNINVAIAPYTNANG